MRARIASGVDGDVRRLLATRSNRRCSDHRARGDHGSGLRLRLTRRATASNATRATAAHTAMT